MRKAVMGWMGVRRRAGHQNNSMDFILRAIRKPLKDLKEGVSRSDLHFWKFALAAKWNIRPNTHTFSSWFTMDVFTCQDPTAQTFRTTLQLHLSQYVLLPTWL